MLARGRWAGGQELGSASCTLKPPLSPDREAQQDLRGSQGQGGEGPKVEEAILHPLSLSSGAFATTESQESGEGRAHWPLTWHKGLPAVWPPASTAPSRTGVESHL